MEFLLEMAQNEVLITTLVAWAIAQGSKIIGETIRSGFNVNRLAGGGGMPSSHGATFSALTLSTALVYRGDSVEFAIVFFLAIIVIYDSHGVRYQSGRIGKYLNAMKKRDEEAGNDVSEGEEFEEVMGHTIPEIVVGIVIGIVVTILMHNLYLLRS